MIFGYMGKSKVSSVAFSFFLHDLLFPDSVFRISSGFAKSRSRSVPWAAGREMCLGPWAVGRGPRAAGLDTWCYP